MSAINIDAALADPQLLGAALGSADSWSTWLVTLKATFGIELDREERRIFASVAGSREPPPQRVQELWAIAGRGGGKSRVSAAIAVYLACFFDHDLDPGETGFVLVLAGSMDQATTVFGYARAFLRKSPILRKMISSTTASEIRLTNGVVIAVHSNSYRLIRGRTLLACVFDEVAYWRDEASATPDREVYRAVLPSLARTGGLLVGISTPYRRSGLLHDKFRDHFDVSDDSVLVVRGGTEAFNPTISRETIAKAISADPEGARSEWEAEFRSDIAALLTLCIGHCEGAKDDATWTCDAIRGRPAPFDPRTVAQEYAALARQYHCTKIVGDNFSGEWVAGAFADAGIKYETSPLPKSSLYLESLPHFNRGAVSIPEHDRLLRELRTLERRVQRSGRDSVDHPKHGSDDYANALCGALYIAMHELRRPRGRMGTYNPYTDGRIRWKDEDEPRQRLRVEYYTPEQARELKEKGMW
jgi:hypothetical protein